MNSKEIRAALKKVELEVIVDGKPQKMWYYQELFDAMRKFDETGIPIGKGLLAAIEEDAKANTFNTSELTKKDIKRALGL